MRDAIIDGETGILVDSEPDLARQWIELANDSSLRNRLSEGARRHASSFRWDQVARDFSIIANHVIRASTEPGS